MCRWWIRRLFIFMDDDSLIKRQAEQPELLSSATMGDGLFAEDEQRVAGVYTAERLFKHKPEIYRAIVALLAEKIGQIRIGGLLGVSPNTVRAVAEREGQSVDMVKKVLSARAMGVASLATEGLEEDLSDPMRRRMIASKDKAIIVGVMVDKGLLLAGEANVRMEISDIKPPDHDAYNAYLAGLKNVTPTRGSGGTAGQKGAADGDGQAGAAGGVPGTVIDVD